MRLMYGDRAVALLGQVDEDLLPRGRWLRLSPVSQKNIYLSSKYLKDPLQNEVKKINKSSRGARTLVARKKNPKK